MYLALAAVYVCSFANTFVTEIKQSNEDSKDITSVFISNVMFAWFDFQKFTLKTTIGCVMDDV